MEKLLIADIGGSTLAESLDQAGTNYAFETILQGTIVKIGLRLAQKVGREYVEVDREITSIRAKIGKLYERPETGKLRLWVGPVGAAPVEGTNLTTAFDINADAETVQAALNNLSIVGTTYGAATVTKDDNLWSVVFDEEVAEVPMRGYEVRCYPISFAWVQASDESGDWVHDVRLEQAGLAFDDQPVTELADPPVVTTFRAGSTNEDGGGANAVQQVQFNPFFRGIYEVRWDDKVSPLLDREDGPDEFAEAIKDLAQDDGAFVVTNPTSGIGHVEFTGSMGAQPQDELEIRVVGSPPGDPHIFLDLGKKTTADVLRQMELDDDDQIEVPLEIEISYRDTNNENRIIVWKYQENVTVRRKLIAEGESTVNDTDYVRPVDPTSYTPFDPSQISNGQQFYPFSLGDETAGPHTVDHQLHTKNVGVDLKEDQPGGKFLHHGTDFQVNFDPLGSGEDSIEITFLGDYATNPPAAGEIIGEVVSRQQTSFFDPHLHPMAQIIGLIEEIDALKARVRDLEDASGTTKLPSTEHSLSGDIAHWSFPSFFEVYPSRQKVEDQGLRLVDLDKTKLKRPRGLFAAVHEPTILALPGGEIPEDPESGAVYENRTAEKVLVPGGMGHRGTKLAPGEFAHFDGRAWHKVSRYRDEETSFYPAAFERELFRIGVTEQQLRLGKHFELAISLEAAVLKANTNAWWTVVLEWGEFTAVEGATVGSNLNQVVWNPTPLLSGRIPLTPVATIHPFGLRIDHLLDDGEPVVEARARVYGDQLLCDTPPTSADFALRGRIIRFDTEDNENDPRGYTALKFDQFETSTEVLQNEAVIP